MRALLILVTSYDITWGPWKSLRPQMKFYAWLLQLLFREKLANGLMTYLGVVSGVFENSQPLFFNAFSVESHEENGTRSDEHSTGQR